MLQFNYTVGGVTTDISRYVDWKSVSIQEQINIPTQLNCNLYNYDILFPKIILRAYVQIFSTRFQRSLFTGYVSSLPNSAFQGLLPGGSQLFSYPLIATSDEHLLNIKAVPFIPAFVNQTQGEVLASLADILCPGMFDTSAVGSGDIEPYFQYDPTQSWCELAKTWGDGSRYRYKVRDKKIWFQPYGDGPLGVTYDESLPDSTFDPSPQGLNTQVLAVPTVNDITIIGAAEAGNSREDYFIGDGFTGNFPLRHKVFEGSSTLLLSDDWTEASFNTQQWFVNDPGDQFNLGDGALNVVSSFALPLGQSYIQMNNGLELAGGIDLEHGEFGFNDYSVGIIGGLYTQSLDTDAPYSSGNCLGGFYISSPSGVVTSASGAAGVVMQPTWMGQPIGPPIVSQVNHTYVLQTVVTSPKYVRYNRWYRSLGGNSYGGVETQVSGNITFIVQDFDIAAATGFYYQPNITKVSIAATDLPAFCQYALMVNAQLNLTVNYTTLALMVLGSLSAYEGPSGLWTPTGLVLPMLPYFASGEVSRFGSGWVVNPGEYSGPVAPWASSSSGNIWPPPLFRGLIPTQEVLGNGFELQAAQITQGNEADTLAFFAQTLPTAGTTIRLQTWESQAAVARLQSSGSIAEEAYVVGDDGLRSAIVSDLNPLPRTSEDCLNACQAFLADRVNVFYNGTYNCTSFFFNQLSSDEQFWPTCGRYLYVNAPARNISRQYMLVTQLTISVLDAFGTNKRVLTGPGTYPGAVGEVLQFSIGFGADLHLEKVLNNFVDTQPTNVLQPSDTAEPVNPLYGYQVDNAYQPDITSIMVNPITDLAAQVTIYDPIPAGVGIEIRLEDANWGQGATPDYVGTETSPNFALVRQQFEQIWYMRFVDTVTGTYSRRSKVVRIYYPVTPLPPTVISADSNFMQFDFNGDIRNVFGFEMRPLVPVYERYGVHSVIVVGFTDGPPIVQKPVVSYGDLNINLAQTQYTSPFVGQSVSVGDIFSAFGPPQSGLPGSRMFNVYFFNHQWSYSEPTVVTVPAPVASGIAENYRFGQSLNLACVLPTEEVVGIGMVPRADLTQQRWQVASGSDFSSGDIVLDQATNFVGPLTANVPANSDLWVRTALFDFIGSGAWAPSITGFHVPLGNLIASDYLASQGSVPPVLTAGSGSLILPPGGYASVGVDADGSNGPDYESGYSGVISGFPSIPYGVGSTITVTLDADITVDSGFDSGSVIYQISTDGGSTWYDLYSTDSTIASMPFVFPLPNAPGNLSNIQLQIFVEADASDGGYAQVFGEITGVSIDVSLGSTGTLATYISTTGSINVQTLPFKLLYPNGSVWPVPSSSGNYTGAIDTGYGLVPGMGYDFYLSIQSAAYADPDVFIDGPYANPSQSALAFSVADGRVSLSAGAVIFYTAATSSGSFGGGGGSYGGGAYCGVLSAVVRMADGREQMLSEVVVGDRLDDGYGGSEEVVGREVVEAQRVRVVKAGRFSTRVASGHTFKKEYGWASIAEIEQGRLEEILLDTLDGMVAIDAVIQDGCADVCHLQLSGPKHTYVLDGFRTHNILVKTE